MMAPQKASSQTVVASNAAKGKKAIKGGTGPADLYHLSPKAILKQVN